MCTLCVNTLPKVVSHYDLSVLLMSVRGLKKSFGCVCGVRPIHVFFNITKPLNVLIYTTSDNETCWIDVARTKL